MPTATAFGARDPRQCPSARSFVDEQGGYIQSGVDRDASTASDANHWACTPSGTVARPFDAPNLGSNDCGYAIFRVYCDRPVAVNFQLEMSFPAGGRGPNDDSMYASLDGDRTYDGDDLFAYHLTRVPPNPQWAATMPAFQNDQNIESGAHFFGVAEREDGTMLRSVRITTGFPSCTFGEPAPPTTADLAAQILRLETATNNRVSVLERNVAGLVTELSALQATAELTASLVGEMSSLREDLQTQSDDASRQTQLVDDRVDAMASRMAVQAAAVPTFAVSSDVSGTGRGSVPTITAEAADLTLATGGGTGVVKLSTAECFETDLCELAQSVAAITAALRQQ